MNFVKISKIPRMINLEKVSHISFDDEKCEIDFFIDTWVFGEDRDLYDKACHAIKEASKALEV